jgi:electron transfer flavoprotein beta subunit
MKVIVCIKQIGYICHPIAIDRRGGDVDPGKIVYMLNPYDELAMEEAIRIKDRFHGTEVVVLTMGPPRAEEALRYAFSFGADKMIRINSANLNPWHTSSVLAKAIDRLGYDIILCGKKAIDSNENMVGSFLAESLDIGQVTGIVKLDVFPDKKEAIAERSVGRGDREVIECGLPALFTVEKGINEPRYPTLPNRLRAEKADVERMEMASPGMEFDLNLGSNQSVNFSPPRPKPKKVFTPDSGLSAGERRRLLMYGGRKAKEGNLIEGAPDKAAEVIMNILIQEKMV